MKTKSNSPPWVFFTFFKFCKWYQIAQSTTIVLLVFKHNSPGDFSFDLPLGGGVYNGLTNMTSIFHKIYTRNKTKLWNVRHETSWIYTGIRHQLIGEAKIRTVEKIELGDVTRASKKLRKKEFERIWKTRLQSSLTLTIYY